MKLEKTQSNSFSAREEKGPAVSRLSGSMYESHLSVYAAAEHHQVSRDNSTESEEPPPTPKSPPPPLDNAVVAGSGCPQENQHQGKELLYTVVALPIDMVFNLLFVQDHFMTDVYTIKKTYDLVFGAWEEQEDGHRGRQITYTMTLPSANLGPKVSYVTEKQVILANSKPGEAYVVEFESTNNGIPYADAFSIASHYCLRKEDENKTRIGVWANIKYKKTLWGLIKTMIEKNAYSGMEGLLAEVVIQLGTEADRLAAPKGARRRRRTMADKNHGASKHSTTTSHAHKADGAGIGRSAVLVMLTAMVVLVVGNAVLYYRLSRLEQKSNPLDNLPASRYLSVTGSWKVVAQILQRQEDIHQKQLEEWKAKLQQASTTLREVQKSLEMIVSTIPEHEENLKRVLEQQSEEVLQGWLQAEGTLTQHLKHLSLEEAVVQRLQKLNSTDTGEVQNSTPDSSDTEHT
ncbi:protein Aster-B-like isoform X1 [Scylla paramamosain]|uniref:protein Aster-B-like isoform X1 n=2 Tax=Scylla paramamosain TaxID=85552 RepID=UPI0030830D93